MPKHKHEKYKLDFLKELKSDRLSRGRKGSRRNTAAGEAARETGTGRVMANFGLHCLVRRDDGTQARMPISRKLGAVAGDRVSFDDQRVITILPRERVLARADAQRTQILAANVDRIVLVQSASNPPYKDGFTDRYQVFASIIGIPCVLLLNKIDEAAPGVQAQAEEHRRYGVTVLPVSAATGEGLDALTDMVRDGVNVFSGHSGVGKSSLLSRIMPKEDIRIGVLNPMLGKGRQKTTATHAYAFRDGFLVDTPGIREFGFVGVDPLRVSRGFPDIREIEAGCKFGNCLHLTEPDCAVRDAVEEGTIPRERYESFLRIVKSLVRD